MLEFRLTNVHPTDLSIIDSIDSICASCSLHSRLVGKHTTTAATLRRIKTLNMTHIALIRNKLESQCLTEAT